jgi:hypothetical protein
MARRGSWQYDGEAIGAGRVYLHSGKDGKLLRTFTSRIPGDAFGFDAVSLGDTDGDGADDLLTTAAWSGVRNAAYFSNTIPAEGNTGNIVSSVRLACAVFVLYPLKLSKM